MGKQWGGRFEEAPDAVVEALGESVSFDARLAPWDIRGSIAHAQMLGRQGIISPGDSRKIVRGLKAIAAEVEAGAFQWQTSLEDVHSNIEAALVAQIGEAGKRLHTARSRNDQVATDERLWLRDQLDVTVERVRDLQHALIALAERHQDIVLPGYTHLQPAQPVLWPHHMLAYFEMLQRDRERLRQLRSRVNILPLGSAALAGTPHPIDRRWVAEALGFDGISANSMDAVGDRDHLIEFCSCASLLMMHLSRLSEELILWSNPRFGFIEIGDAFTTGSSIMPQKKNPDVAELIRGKTGRVYGDLVGLLTMMKGLPLTYNRDLQEDKEPLFDAADTVLLCVTAMARMLGTVKVNADAVKAALEEGFLEATDLADYLAGRGVPFREAHEITGKIVLYCIRQKKALPQLTTDELRQFSRSFDDSARDVLQTTCLVSRRNTPGGTAPSRVRAALRRARRLSEM